MRSAGVAVALAMTVLISAGPAAAGNDVAQDVSVVKVVDGDTIDVSWPDGPERVRFLNVDTPEVGTCLASRATSATSKLVGSGDGLVDLLFDVDRTDRYGRTLAMVRNSSRQRISVELARSGLGVPMLVQPNDRYYSAVVTAAERARREGVGLFDRRIGCTPARRMSQARDRAHEARAMPVRTKTQYSQALAELRATDAFVRKATPAHYGLTGTWVRTYLTSIRVGVRTTIKNVRKLKVKQRRHFLDTHRPSPPSTGGGGSGGGPGGYWPPGVSPGYTGPRCYEPGGVIWHPCG